MKVMSAVFYELTAEEVRTLPRGWQVLVYDMLYNRYTVEEVGAWKIPRDIRRFAFISLKVPPLPKLAAEYRTCGEGVEA